MANEVSEDALKAELVTHGKTCQCAHKKMCEDREEWLVAEIARRGVSEDVELKPCPFCGSHAHVRGSQSRAYWVECVICEVGTKYGDSIKQVAEVWNTRANSFSKEAEDKDKSLGEGGEGTVAASVVIPGDRTVSAALPNPNCFGFRVARRVQLETRCFSNISREMHAAAIIEDDFVLETDARTQRLEAQLEGLMNCLAQCQQDKETALSHAASASAPSTTVPDENSVPHQTDSEPDKTGLLHVAICQAVTLMNSELQTGGNSQAHTILRQALVDYADSVRVQPLGDHSEHEVEQELG